MNNTKSVKKEINKAEEEHIQKVKKYLKQAEKLDGLIKSNRIELKELREDAKNLGALDYSKDKVKTNSANNAGYTKTIEKIAALDKKICEDIDKLLDLKMQIRTAINEVEDYGERLILRLKYLNFISWDNICKITGNSERTVHRIHGDALKKFKIP